MLRGLRWFTALLVVALTGPALASSYGTGPQGLEEPARVLRQGIETLTGYLENNADSSPEQLRAWLEREMVPYFDFEQMTHWAAGPLNRYLDQRQRVFLQGRLKEMFLASMSERLIGYHHSRIRYLQPRPGPRANTAILSVQVQSAAEPPLQLDFRLTHSRSGWRVADVAANGSSAVAHYREQFNGMAQRYGVQGMLARLAGE